MSDDHIDFFNQLLKSTSIQNGECIEWTGKLTPSGYGYLYAFKKSWQAHRVAFLVDRGFLPTNLYICHKCNNKKCINPEHLYAGTAKDNWRDFRNSDSYGISLEKMESSRKIREKGRLKILEKEFLDSQKNLFKRIYGFDIEELITKILQSKENNNIK